MIADRIAAIVLNYNNYEETMQCVDNLIDKKLDIAIVVVDNCSTNDSVEQLRKKYSSIKNIILLEAAENKGYAAGNNIGFKYVFEELDSIGFVTIMNPDTTFNDPQLLDKLATKLENHPEAAVIAPIMVQHGVWDIRKTYWDIPTTWDICRRQFIFCNKRNQSNIVLNSDNTAFVGTVSGSFLMLKKEALLDIDYLDESTFLYGEENMLALDLKQKGYKELLDVSSVFFHNHRKRKSRVSLKKKIRVAGISSDSRLSVIKKHYSRSLIPLMKVIYILNIFIILCKHLLGEIKSHVWGG